MHADPEAIQQIEIEGQLKNIDDVNGVATWNGDLCCNPFRKNQRRNETKNKTRTTSRITLIYPQNNFRYNE